MLNRQERKGRQEVSSEVFAFLGVLGALAVGFVRCSKFILGDQHRLVLDRATPIRLPRRLRGGFPPALPSANGALARGRVDGQFWTIRPLYVALHLRRDRAGLLASETRSPRRAIRRRGP